MTELGIIYFTGDVFRVGYDNKHEREPFQVLPLRIGYSANFIVNLATGQEIKNRWREGPLIIVSDNVKRIFIDSPLLSIDELKHQAEVILAKERVRYSLQEQIAKHKAEIELLTGDIAKL